MGLEMLWTLIKWPIGKFAASLGGKIGQGVLVEIKGFILSRGLGSHINSLKAEIRSMPFIYRDLELNALDDFVHIELSQLDRRTLQVHPTALRSTKNDWDRILESKSAILFGEAGIGKTTLFRHLLLNAAESPKEQKIFPLQEKLVPIYVPMKAIDANGTSPILRYITSHYKYFSGEPGLKRLVKLARRGRVLLLLDGYDEIPHVSGAKIINAELENLFEVSSSRVTRGVNQKFSNIYPLLRGGRILMSTRREFFSSFPVVTGGNTRFLFNAGVASHRQELVSKIFKRYKSNAPTIYAGRLNEELFLQRLSQASKSSISQISYNPLFLTVLCYTYTSHIRDGIDPERVWARGTHELIGECVRLLVSDIDKSKVRGLPPDESEAVMNRRASYAPEKIEFLRFLAGACYLEGVSLLDSKWIEEKVREHFSANQSKAGSEIIAGLQERNATVNIIQQLEFSGVLAKIGFTRDGISYDFPHRRFREVLAADYFNTDDRCEILLSRFGDSDIAAFLAYYAISTERLHEVGLALAGKMSEPSAALQSIFKQIVEACVTENDRRALLREVVKLAVGKGNICLPEELLGYFAFEEKEIYLLTLKNSAVENNALAFASVTKILKKIDRIGLCAACCEICEDSKFSLDIRWLAFGEVLESRESREISNKLKLLTAVWTDFSFKNVLVVRLAKLIARPYVNESSTRAAIGDALRLNVDFQGSTLDALLTDMLKYKSMDYSNEEGKKTRSSKLFRLFTALPNPVQTTFWV